LGLDGMEHISQVSYCDFAKDDVLKKGDLLFVVASYNSSEHMMMAGHGAGKLELKNRT